jgi:hypothetical protein
MRMRKKNTLYLKNTDPVFIGKKVEPVDGDLNQMKAEIFAKLEKDERNNKKLWDEELNRNLKNPPYELDEKEPVISITPMYSNDPEMEQDYQEGYGRWVRDMDNDVNKDRDHIDFPEEN